MHSTGQGRQGRQGSSTGEGWQDAAPARSKGYIRKGLRTFSFCSIFLDPLDWRMEPAIHPPDLCIRANTQPPIRIAGLRIRDLSINLIVIGFRTPIFFCNRV